MSWRTKNIQQLKSAPFWIYYGILMKFNRVASHIPHSLENVRFNKYFSWMIFFSSGAREIFDAKIKIHNTHFPLFFVVTLTRNSDCEFFVSLDWIFASRYLCTGKNGITHFCLEKTSKNWRIFSVLSTKKIEECHMMSWLLHRLTGFTLHIFSYTAHCSYNNTRANTNQILILW